MKFEIKNRFTGNVQFECKLDIEHQTKSTNFKLGLAVKIAIKQGADLRGTYLRGTYLRGADLRDADLRGADLRDADLRGADLRGVDLQGADLRDADLRGTYLRDADLRGTYLRGADLRDADLRGADLRGADLRDADLRGVDLRGADLRGAKYTDEITIEKEPLFILGLNWDVTILDTHMKIGCELHKLKDWELFDNKRILEMDGKTALKFWKVNKEGLLTIARSNGRI